MTAPEFVSPEPGDAGDLELAFAMLDDALDRLSRDSHARLDQRDDDLSALELLFDLRESRKLLAEIEASVEAIAAQRMKGPKVAWPGFLAERKGGLERRKWDARRLAWAVLSPLAVDVNGELDDAAAALVSSCGDRLLEVAAISYFRVTPLKAMGLNPGDYCETTTGRRTVQVMRSAEELQP